MGPNNIMFSKISESEKDKYCTISLTCRILNKERERERKQACGFQRQFVEGEQKEVEEQLIFSGEGQYD